MTKLPLKVQSQPCERRLLGCEPCLMHKARLAPCSLPLVDDAALRRLIDGFACGNYGLRRGLSAWLGLNGRARLLCECFNGRFCGNVAQVVLARFNNILLDRFDIRQFADLLFVRSVYPAI